MSEAADPGDSKNANFKDPKNIEIRFVTDWPVDELVDLYKTGGWWKDHYDPAGIKPLIKGSYVFAVAVNKLTSTAVGMGRVISDGVSDAYIQDTVVLQEHRGQGIGIKIVRALLEYCLEKKLQWIGLVAEPGTKSFYTRLGFKELPGEPMVYQPEG